MKFKPETSNTPTISAIDEAAIYLAGERITYSLVIDSRGERHDWQVAHFNDLSASHFEQLIKDAPELIIFGSGKTIRFAPPHLLVSLMQARVGIETMSTAAAARTYNILAHEGRHVVGAFLQETSSQS